MNKKIFAALLSFITVCLGISAQEAIKKHGHLALGVEASTTGLGLELATSLNSNFALRGGVSFLPAYSYDATFKVNMTENDKNTINKAINSDPRIPIALNQLGLPTSAEEINTDVNSTATLDFINGKILLDIYPWSKYTFHLTGGVYIGKSNIVKINGKMDKTVEFLDVLNQYGVNFYDEPFIIDQDYQLKGKDITDMRGAISVTTVKPYFGLGFGRAVPHKRVGVSFEIGAFYQGSPKLVSDNKNVQSLIDAKLAEVSNVADAVKKVPIYPVISLKLNFRLF